MKLAFMINDYDSDGDIVDKCIKLYCDEKTILIFKDWHELESFADIILGMESEILEQLKRNNH